MVAGQSDEQAAGDDTLPDFSAQPQLKVTADAKVISDVIAGCPERRQNAGGARPKWPCRRRS